MDHSRAPLFEAVRRHAARKPLQFHIPGHKGGAGMDPEFRKSVGENVVAIGLINSARLDALHRPAGVLRDAQELAADAYGPGARFYSAQEASTSIMTMILSVCRE